jgi:hypothetical protein
MCIISRTYWQCMLLPLYFRGSTNHAVNVLATLYSSSASYAYLSSL